jgi:predicted O-methyltransferase YrrM
MIICENIDEYIRKLVTIEDCFLNEMSNYAKENKVPIIKPEVAALIDIMVRIIRPVRILEIGTAIGYSAIVMTNGLAESGRIDTIERNEIMVSEARKNILKAGLTEKINIINGEAEEVLRMLNNKYDMIFLDGAKGQYKEFLYDILRILKPGGVLISDNVFYKGMVVDSSLVEKRKKTIAKNLNEYLRKLTTSPYLKTSIISAGDGMAISYKTGDIL